MNHLYRNILIFIIFCINSYLFYSFYVQSLHSFKNLAFEEVWLKSQMNNIESKSKLLLFILLKIINYLIYNEYCIICRIDYFSDIFSMGIVIHELLAGLNKLQLKWLNLVNKIKYLLLFPGRWKNCLHIYWERFVII